MISIYHIVSNNETSFENQQNITGFGENKNRKIIYKKINNDDNTINRLINEIASINCENVNILILCSSYDPIKNITFSDSAWNKLNSFIEQTQTNQINKMIKNITIYNITHYKNNIVSNQ
jgi:hypothetical protein